MSRVVYLHGFASSPLSKKARWFGERFAAKGIALEVPDLAAGDFEHLTISGQLRVIEAACKDEAVVLMGSSMGGYLAALYAARHPEVQKLVLMAPAFCFARRWRQPFAGGFLPVYHYGEGRTINLSYGIIEDGERYEDYPDCGQPALIFHGTHDTVVPAELSGEFAARQAGAKVRLLESDHELIDVLDTMWTETVEFLGL